jgi:conjugative transfer signal peptidase TraF
VKRTVVATVAAVVVACGVVAAGYAAGARICTTRSIPVGLYWVSHSVVAKGSYVQLCPPPGGLFDEARARGYVTSGPCPGSYGYLMKRVAALAGDVVAFEDDGVHVNGQVLPHSRPVATDPGGRPLPRLRANQRSLSNSEVLLMSDVSDSSFDGRYFGPIGLSQIRTVVRPVVTW